MSYLNKKQRIIVGILVSIIVASICYYIYAKDINFLTEQEKNLEVEENQIESPKDKNENNENYSDAIIMVHVSGAVNKEGIVELKQNSRIADAIEKAEGLKEEACIDEINLAYVLEDGMKIHIPTTEEQKKNDSIEQEKNYMQDEEKQYITKSSGAKIENEVQSTSMENQTSKININTATQMELETLPGIGPSTALKIINYRSEKGKFKAIEDIKEVSGIGESKFNNIKNLITV